MDWNGLQFLLALSREGSLQRAAENLGVNRTTVSRNLAQLEDRLGVKLVEKAGRDLVLTAAGVEAVAAAELVEGEFHNLQRRVFGRDQALSGVVRLTVTQGIGCLLAEPLARFQDSYPDVNLELSVTNATEDLELMESDIALRFTQNPPESLVGRIVARPMTALYASRQLASRFDALDEVEFITSHVSRVVGNVRLDKQLRTVIRTNSLEVVREMVALGKGIAQFPCYMVAGDPRLVRVSDIEQDAMPELWLLYHPRLRTQMRVRRLVDHLVASFEELQPLIEGTSK